MRVGRWIRVDRNKAEFWIEDLWALESAAIGYHLAAAVWIAICLWQGLPSAAVALAAFFLVAAALILRLDGYHSRRADRAGPDRPAPPQTEMAGHPGHQRRAATGRDTDGGSARDPAPPRKSRPFWEEADSLLGAIDSAVRSLVTQAAGSDPGRAPDPGELGEVDALLLSYKLTMASYRFRHRSPDERLLTLLHLGMVARLSEARRRAYQSRIRELDRELDTDIGGRTPQGFQKASYEAATLCLRSAEADIAVCLEHLETGLAQPSWAFYRELVGRELVGGAADLEGRHGSLLRILFRTLDHAIEFDGAEAGIEERGSSAGDRREIARQ